MGANPGREAFGVRFWVLRGSGTGYKTASMEMRRNNRFGPNHGREPSAPQFWTFATLGPAIKLLI